MTAAPQLERQIHTAHRFARDSALRLLGLCLRPDGEAAALPDRELGERALDGVRSGAATLLRASGVDDPELSEQYQNLVGSLFLSEFDRLCAAWRAKGGRA